MVIVETQKNLEKRKIKLALESYEQKKEKKKILPWILLNGLKVLEIYSWRFSSSTVFKNWRESICKSTSRRKLLFMYLS